MRPPTSSAGNAEKANEPVAGEVSRRLVRNGLWSNAAAMLPVAISLVVTPYLIHGFGLARWGVYLLVQTISNFLGPLNSGIGGSVGRFFAIYASQDDRTKTTRLLLTFASALIVVGTLAGIVGWFVAPVIITVFHVPVSYVAESTYLLRALVLLVVIGFVHNLFAAVVNSRQLYGYSSVTYILSYLLWAGGLVGVVHFHGGLRDVAWVLVGQQALATLLIVPQALRYLSREGLSLLPWIEVKEVLKYAASVQAMGTIGLVSSEVASLIVGGVFSVRGLALYNSGANFALNFRGVATNLLNPAGTHLAQTYGSEGEEGAIRDLVLVQRVWVIASTGWSVVGCSAAYFAVTAWLGPGFGTAGWVATALLAGSVFNLPTGALTQYLAAVGRPDLEVRYASLGTAINIALVGPFLLAGPIGVGGAIALGTAVGSLMLVRIVRRRHRYDVRHFLRDVPVVAAIGAIGTTVLLETVMRAYSPTGPLGLAYVGLIAAVGLLAFGALVLRSRMRELFALGRSRAISLHAISLLLAEGANT